MPSIEQVQELWNVPHHHCWLRARSLYAVDSVLVLVPVVAQPAIAHARTAPINAAFRFMLALSSSFDSKPDDPGSGGPATLALPGQPLLCDDLGEGPP